jgi:hypothetical protein
MFVQQVPQNYPYLRSVNEPQFRPTSAPAWQPQDYPQQARAPQPGDRRPLIRLKGPDEDDPAPTRLATRPASPVRLRLPSPGELGLQGVGAAHSETSGAKAVVDWADVHRRLDRLGALSFHQEKLPEGGYRVTFLLPSDQPNRAHQIDARAETVAEAVGLALERAEKWGEQRD